MLNVKRGDTHDVVLTIEDREGKPVDLTGATVTVYAKRRRGSVASVKLAVTIVDPPAEGKVRHRLTGALQAGEYGLEIEIVRNNIITTAPTSGTMVLVVEPDIT